MAITAATRKPLRNLLFPGSELFSSECIWLTAAKRGNRGRIQLITMNNHHQSSQISPVPSTSTCLQKRQMSQDNGPVLLNLDSVLRCWSPSLTYSEFPLSSRIRRMESWKRVKQVVPRSYDLVIPLYSI